MHVIRPAIHMCILQVVDSVAALVPKAELEGDMGDHHIALQARLMSQALRKLTGAISKTKVWCVDLRREESSASASSTLPLNRPPRPTTHKCLLVFINQVRQKVGVIFGSNEVTTGGTALRFYSSVSRPCDMHTHTHTNDSRVAWHSHTHPSR